MNTQIRIMKYYKTFFSLNKKAFVLILLVQRTFWKIIKNLNLVLRMCLVLLNLYLISTISKRNGVRISVSMSLKHAQATRPT